MEFSQPKGIYLQIADQIRDRILAGEWRSGERIPSIRELAVNVGVNPNTVTKSYQALLDREIAELKSVSRDAAKSEAAKIVADAERLAEHLRHEARRIADAEIDRARAALRAEIVESLRTSVTGKIQRELDPAAQLALVHRRVAELKSIKAEA